MMPNNERAGLADDTADALAADPLAARLQAYVPRGVAARLPLPVGWTHDTQAAVLYADLVGFTVLSAALALLPDGAEQVSVALTAVFTALIAAVHAAGGDVVKFAGDSLLAVFPSDAQADAAGAAIAALALPTVDTPTGPVQLTLRAGSGAGPVLWQIVGRPAGEHYWVLTGLGLRRALRAEAAALPGTVRRGAGRVGRPAVPLAPTARPPPVAALAPYVPTAVVARLAAGLDPFLGEYRRVAVAFVALRPDGDLQELVAAALPIVAAAGGRLNEVEVGDKGPLLLILFGAPTAQGDDARRAVETLLALRAAGVLHRAGLALGQTFVGEIGPPLRRAYSALGVEVNLAARLMQAAPAGTILLSARVYAAAGPGWRVTARRPWLPKGFSQPITIYRLDGRSAEPPAVGAILLGRRAELAVADDRLERLAGGAGGLLRLVGEPGIGKTRLAEAVAARAAARGWRVVVGSAALAHQNRPYSLWHAPLRALLGLPLGDAPPAAGGVPARLAALCPDRVVEAPLLAEALGIPMADTPATAGLPPQARSGATRTLLIALLRAATGGAPTVVRLEDLHWADSLSLDLLTDLAQSGAPLLLLATHRPFGLPAPPFLAALPPHRALVLSELDPPAATDLVRTRAPDLPTAMVAAIVERGQGHPFFLEELIRMYEETGTLDLSPTVGGVIQARIDHLAEAARLTLRVAGVLGRVFSPRDLAAIYPLPLTPAVLTAHLGELARFGLTLLERADPPQYTFKHAITQEIAYGNLLHTQRRSLHAAAGDWYCRVAPADVALIAYHYDQAAAWDRAVPYLLRAAEAARLAYANQEAVRLYSRALAVTAADDPASRFSALLGRVAVWELLGDRPAQWADLLRLEALAPDLELRQQAQVAVQTVRYHEAVGNNRQQQIAADWAVAVATVAADYESLAEAYFYAGRAFYMQRKLDAACAAALRGFWLAHSRRDHTGIARFLSALGGIADHRSHYAQAVRLFARSRRLYQAAGDRMGITNLAVRQAGVLAVTGDYPAAQRLYEEALAFYRQIGDRHQVAGTLKDLGDVTQSLGDYAGTIRYVQEARSLFHAVADWVHEIICVLMLTDVAVAQNQPAAGLPLIQLAEESVARWPDSHIAGYVATCRGRLAEALGDLPHAADRFAFVLALPLAATEVSVRAPALAGQARVALAQGDHALAATAVAACLSALTLVQGDQPLEIYDSCCMVLAGLGDGATAQTVCAVAYGRLQAAAARISDPAQRMAFLGQVPVNRRVAAAAQASGVAPPSSPPAR